MPLPLNSNPHDRAETRRRAVAMLRSGRASVAEVAALANTTRSHVAYWARVAGIDVHAARAAYLVRLWDAPAYAPGSGSAPAPSRASAS